jgi:23S rRNA (guanosine2251-2'-O)-methyltransferase
MQDEIIYGIHPVQEALGAARRQFKTLFITAGSTSKRRLELQEQAQKRSISVKKVTPSELGHLAGTDHHQGVAARVTTYATVGLDDIFNDGRQSHERLFILMLDHILDPQNVGAIIRTALGVGIDAIIIPKDRAVGPTPTVSKASAGALEHIRMVRVTNMVRTIEQLKSRGLWIYGLDPLAPATLYSVRFTGPMALVIGGEEKGIRPLVKKSCDQLLSIPLLGRVDSLNASVAAAVSLYEVFRQRMSA